MEHAVPGGRHVAMLELPWRRPPSRPSTARAGDVLGDCRLVHRVGTNEYGHLWFWKCTQCGEIGGPTVVAQLRFQAKKGRRHGCVGRRRGPARRPQEEHRIPPSVALRAVEHIPADPDPLAASWATGVGWYTECGADGAETHVLGGEEMRRLLDDVAALPYRERLVIQMRFGLGDYDEHTLSEAGDQIGVSRERARQIEAKALYCLRVGVPFVRLFGYEGLGQRESERRSAETRREMDRRRDFKSAVATELARVTPCVAEIRRLRSEIESLEQETATTGTSADERLMKIRKDMYEERDRVIAEWRAPRGIPDSAEPPPIGQVDAELSARYEEMRLRWGRAVEESRRSYVDAVQKLIQAKIRLADVTIERRREIRRIRSRIASEHPRPSPDLSARQTSKVGAGD